MRPQKNFGFANCKECQKLFKKKTSLNVFCSRTCSREFFYTHNNVLKNLKGGKKNGN